MARRSLKNVSRLLDSVSKSVPVEEEFLRDFKRGIELLADPPKPASKTFKPSSMQCKRNSYFQLMGVVPDEFDSPYNLTGICNAGSDIHERTQGYISNFENLGIDCEWVNVGNYITSHNLSDIEVRERIGMEYKLYNSRYNISFMCDGLIRYKGRYYILEIKTETSSKWYSRNGVDPKHYHQAICYSLSLKLDDVIFLYINRDMLEAKAFRFNVTDSMRKEITDYIEDVDGYVDRMIVPPKDAKLDKRVCTYCSYKSSCKKER